MRSDLVSMSRAMTGTLSLNVIADRHADNYLAVIALVAIATEWVK